MKKIVVYLAAAALMLNVLTGCELLEKLAGDYGESAAEMTEGELIPETAVSNDISLGIIDFDTFNPLITNSQTVKECMQFVYEPLFDVDEKMRIVPVLAESYTISPDGRTIDIQLRHDVTWHDGSAFTSSDVAYTIKQIRAGLTPYGGNLENVADYMGIDNDKLRLTLNYAIPDFVSLLNFPIIKYQSDMSGNANFIPIGTGAFCYNSQPSTDKLLFTAYDAYYRGRATLDGIKVYLLPSLEKYESMFEASEIDVMTGDTADLSEYTPRGSVKSNEYVTNNLTYLGFNTQNPILSGSETRKGISKLLDKDGIVTSVIYSRGVAVDVPINPTSIYYYDTNTKMKKDEPSALSHLGNDGWGTNVNGDYVRMFDGKVQILSLSLLTDSDNGVKTAVAEKIAKDLNDFGISTEVIALPYDEYRERVNTMNYDMVIDEIFAAPNNDLSPLISSAGNSLGYVNYDLDALVGQMGITHDEQQLIELYKQYGEGIVYDMPFAALYFSKNVVLSSAKIKSELLPSITRQYRNVGNWSVK